MYIMTNADPNRDLIRVYDTDDGTNEVVPFGRVARDVRSGKFRVAGVSTSLNEDNRKDASFVRQHGVYLSMLEARISLARHYSSKGMQWNEALRKVGLAR